MIISDSEDNFAKSFRSSSLRSGAIARRCLEILRIFLSNQKASTLILVEALYKRKNFEQKRYKL